MAPCIKVNSLNRIHCFASRQAGGQAGGRAGGRAGRQAGGQAGMQAAGLDIKVVSILASGPVDLKLLACLKGYWPKYCKSNTCMLLLRCHLLYKTKVRQE